MTNLKHILKYYRCGIFTVSQAVLCLSDYLCFRVFIFAFGSIFKIIIPHSQSITVAQVSYWRRRYIKHQFPYPKPKINEDLEICYYKDGDQKDYVHWITGLWRWKMPLLHSGFRTLKMINLARFFFSAYVWTPKFGLVP